MDNDSIYSQAREILDKLGERVYMLIPNEDPEATPDSKIQTRFLAFRGFGIEVNSLRNLSIEYADQVVFANHTAMQTGAWETVFANLYSKLPNLIRLRHLRDGVIDLAPTLNTFLEYEAEISDDTYGKRVKFYWRQKPKLFHKAEPKLVFDYDYDTFPLTKGAWYDYVSQQIINQQRAKLPLAHT